jgi:hypothetical protein
MVASTTWPEAAARRRASTRATSASRARNRKDVKRYSSVSVCRHHNDASLENKAALPDRFAILM